MKTKILIISLIALLAIALTACGAGNPPADDQSQEIKDYSLGKPFELFLGDVVTAGDSAVLIGVDAFVEDSRCPINAMCIVAGLATVRLEVNGEMVELSLGADAENPSQIALEGGYSLEVLEIRPFPGSPESDAGAAKSVVLVVTGGDTN